MKMLLRLPQKDEKFRRYKELYTRVYTPKRTNEGRKQLNWQNKLRVFTSIVYQLELIVYGEQNGLPKFEIEEPLTMNDGKIQTNAPNPTQIIKQ